MRVFKFYSIRALYVLFAAIMLCAALLYENSSAIQPDSVSYNHKTVNLTSTDYLNCQSLNSFAENPSITHHRIAIIRIRYQHTLKVLSKIKPETINRKYPETIALEYSKPKYTEKSNHYCFLI